MAESGFHFAQPGWFWALALVLPVALWLWRSASKAARGPIQRYADAHLLPHLTGSRELRTIERWGRFLGWVLLWALLVAAMAGPRWDYEDVRLFHPGDNLLMLVDISRSMQVEDVPPNRLARARQEIQDLILANRQVRLGLIAFASVPHVLSPITEDTYTILNTLPALSSDLAEYQGSRLDAALERAETLLSGLPEDSGRAILLVTDGDFEPEGLVALIQRLAATGIRLHVLGLGTTEGARVPLANGRWLTDGYGKTIRSPLNEDLLRDLAEAGNGIYQQADYRERDTLSILRAATVTDRPPEASDERTRVWNERFYLLVILVCLLLLPRFRGWLGR